MSIAIQIENISKKYVIGHQRTERYLTFRDAITSKLHTVGKRLIHPFKSSSNLPMTGMDTTEELWALKDISLNISEGEKLGIIGKNGAGKTTLLKILSRITEPTKGIAKVRGRVASLLEVGTGFHPELTGRENIYLNGAIMGMSKYEITSKFDEIVAFAEVEKFLDTPVKRYSSGMYVRLAFAVAAHLDPEILIVDEVLAVGDIQFQKKCIGKMEDVSSSGKTILLVSHNMASILSLSTKCILLSNGKLVKEGAPQDVISLYQNEHIEQSLNRTDLTQAERYGTGVGRFESITMTPKDNDGNTMPFPVSGCDLRFELKIKANEDLKDCMVAIIIYDELGNRIIDANTLIKGDGLTISKGEKATVFFDLKNVRLKPDLYTVGLWLGIINDSDFDGIRYATTVRIEAIKEEIQYTAPFPGVYACEFEYNRIVH